MRNGMWGRLASVAVMLSVMAFAGATHGATSFAHAAVTLEVLNPRAEFTPPAIVPPSPRVADLAGKKIGLYWNGKAGADNYLDVVEELLKAKYPTATIKRYRGPFDLGENAASKIAGECDLFIYGVSDTTSCAGAGVLGSSRLEKKGKPVVFAVTDKFAQNARSSAEDIGMPGLRIAPVPGDEYYRLRISREEVRPVVEATLGSLIEALTRPLTETERSTKTKKVEMPRTLKVTGKNYGDALEKFNRLFLDKHWGAGLPLIPPTAERVRWMLAGTSRSPKEVIGKVAPKNGVATVEKIAINAVMAGARPEYLSVIIAAIEAVTDRYDIEHVMTSTGSFTLLIQVNGPIAKEIGMNSGIGFLGYGWRANDTIGHAVRLALINFGYLWPNRNDVALTGRPSSHTFFTFAENEEQSPWEPYHVALGYKPDESCVTVSTVWPIPTNFGGGAVATWSGQGILDAIVTYMSADRARMTIWRLGTAIPSPNRYALLLQPEVAKELSRLGYTRKSLQKYLHERTSIAYEDLTQKEKDAMLRRIEAGDIPEDRVAVFKEAMKPGGRVPLLLRPEDSHIIVAGGIPGYSFGTWYFSIPPYKPLGVQTKRIRNGTLTKAGR